MRIDDFTFDGEALDVSARGIGVAFPTVNGLPQRDAEVEIIYRVQGFREVQLRAVVAHTSSLDAVGREMTRVGLHFLPSASSGRMRVGNHRKYPRFACPPPFSVTATSRSKLFFREWLHFVVDDVGAGGLTLLGSSPTPEMVKGAELDLRVEFPTVGAVEIRGQVRSVRLIRSGVRVGVSFLSATEDIHAAIAEYLLMVEKSLSPQALRKAGFAVASMERSVRFDYAEGPTDFAEVLRLRLTANQNEGRLDGLTAPEMASPFDAHARHIVGRFGHRIVACGRVIFVDGHPERSEYISKGGHVVPPWLWEAGFCESGANAVDPEFQRTDLYLALLRNAVRVAMHGGLRYVLGASPPHLVAAYERLGCRALEARTVTPKPGWTFVSTLMLIDVDELEKSSEQTAFDSVFRFVAAREVNSEPPAVETTVDKDETKEK